MATSVDRAACTMLLLPVVAFLVLASLPSAAVATNYTVGDEKRWNPKVDYTAWVKKHKPFYKGDRLRVKIDEEAQLVFQYQNGRSDVVQVDEVGYTNCDKESAITSHSKGTTYAFQLKEAKDYFFICNYGYCYSGMKLAVTAKKGSASSSSSSSSSSSDSNSDSSSSSSPASKSSSKSAAATLAAGQGGASTLAAAIGAAAMLLRML